MSVNALSDQPNDAREVAAALGTMRDHGLRAADAIEVLRGAALVVMSDNPGGAE